MGVVSPPAPVSSQVLHVRPGGLVQAGLARVGLIFGGAKTLLKLGGARLDGARDVKILGQWEGYPGHPPKFRSV